MRFALFMMLFGVSSHVLAADGSALPHEPLTEEEVRILDNLPEAGSMESENIMLPNEADMRGFLCEHDGEWAAQHKVDCSSSPAHK